MRTVRRLVSVFLLLCLAVGCAGTDGSKKVQKPEVVNGVDTPFCEDRERIFEPQEFTGTVWDWGASDGFALWFVVSETDEVCMMLHLSDCWLRPNGDTFTLEMRFYRTPYDKTPYFVLPVGEARLTTDGTVCRFELLSKSDAFDLPAVEPHSVIYFQRSKEPAEEQAKYYHDIVYMEYLPHEQPNTDWYDEANGARFHVDVDSAVKGTIPIGNASVSCELLVGHRGSAQIYALVKENAKTAEDVLLIGTIPNYWDDPQPKNTRFHAFNLEKIRTDDNSESNWIDMELSELLQRMETDGWSSEAVTFYDESASEIVRLQKDDQTVLLIADSHVIAYARYEGRKLLSWGGEKPMDHTVVDIQPNQKNHLFVVFNNGGINDRMQNEYWLLDDCRLAVAESSYSTDCIIYDALTGEVN